MHTPDATSLTARQEYYDTLYSGVDGARLRRATIAKLQGVLHEADLAEPRRILDVGCGPGTVSRTLAEAGHDVTGVDAAQSAVDQAQAHGLHAVRWDLEGVATTPLPFKDASFDIILALDILEHLFDPARLLSEVKRLLAPNGLFIALFPNHFDIKNRWRILRGQGIVHWDHTFVQPEDYFHIRFWTYAQSRRFLENNGFYIHRTQLAYLRWLFGGRWLDFNWRIRSQLVKHFPDLFAGRFVFGARLAPPDEEEQCFLSQNPN